MEEYLLLKQGKSRKERNKLPFRHTWTLSSDDDEEESYDFCAIRIPTIVIDDVISPEVARDEEESQVFDLNEYPAIVNK